MSIHIGAAPSDIAPVVLMPGDPLRAKWIAEAFVTGEEATSAEREQTFGAMIEIALTAALDD